MSIDGAAAEAVAARFLIRHGLKIVARNYRCRLGEIDLIALDGNTLVFVEVKARSGSGFGGSIYSITPAKQRKLLATAQHYLASLGREPACRFDAVLFEGQGAPTWLRNILEA
ncbi:YraN family protein [Chitinivorax sp. B]|uniref:YraN family protein n=1 Tax=Chitinivorax sp. B TaxID=2502235 RepID=UPI0010F55138|nr:YraN family protein [Chitinivorax sp. B]